MIYFKAKKNFQFGNNIPVIVEVFHSSYNFITNEWILQTNFYLNENDLISNKVKKEISKYIIEHGSSLSEEKLSILIDNYIELPEIIPILSTSVNLFFVQKEGEFPLNFENMDKMKAFLLGTITENPSLLGVESGSLSLYPEEVFHKKIIELRDSALA